MERITIEKHFLNQQGNNELPSDLINILYDINLAGKMIRKQVVINGLTDQTGDANVTNASGESVQKLDIYANDSIRSILTAHGRVAIMASEEEEDIIPCDPSAEYVILFDPLDGSSNIDVNVSVGTIFSIYKVNKDGKTPTEKTLRKGSEQVAAGYIIYGSSVVMVYTAGDGVFGFTYDPSLGEFFLSHDRITIPNKASYFSVNEGLTPHMHPGTKSVLEELKSDDPENGYPLSARYVGSLVADFHRNLIKGGIYLYPGTSKSPNGKLRLMYEANPLAFICEQAGGKASTGSQRILDIEPTDVHQRIPLIIGNAELVDLVESFEKTAVL